MRHARDMRTRTGTWLTEAYWCHADGQGDPGTPAHPPPTCLLPTAGRAMDWMRACVRNAAGGLDHHPFMAVWRWLNDQDGLDTALARLRDGAGYSFSVDTGFDHRTWSVHPVLLLPLLDDDRSDSS
ncbi:MAG: hypothetical protein JWL99_3814 [Streptomyces oryziradicis]|jgi:hypothetical protein|nr:hypothetical protein [Actinacidiphila oryziradicis]